MTHSGLSSPTHPVICSNRLAGPAASPRCPQGQSRDRRGLLCKGTGWPEGEQWEAAPVLCVALGSSLPACSLCRHSSSVGPQ